MAAADVVLNGDTLELHGHVVAVDNELASQGPLAGLCFTDRSAPDTRYVLYADQGQVRLWRSDLGDMLTLTVKGKQLVLAGEHLHLLLEADTATVFKYQYLAKVRPRPGVTPMPTPTHTNPDHVVIPGLDQSKYKPFDLLKKIAALEKRIAQLEHPG